MGNHAKRPFNCTKTDMKQLITATRKGKVVYQSEFSRDADLAELVKAYEQTGCEVSVTLVDRQAYGNFDDYAKDFPEGEQWRNWCMNTYPHSHIPYKHYAVIPGYTSCLPGNYLPAHVSEYKGKYYVHVNDGDDCMVRKAFDTEDDAVQELNNLKLLAPFSVFDLHRVFGYEI